MSTITAEVKDEIFRHPRSGTVHFGRRLSTVSRGQEIWAAVQMGEGKTTRVLVMHQHGSRPPRYFETPSGLVHEPTLAIDPGGGVAAVWNQASPSGWEICVARLEPRGGGFAPTETIYRSAQLCLPPSATFDRGKLRVAWSARTAGRFRIHCLVQGEAGWPEPQLLSDQEVDAFRPHLSSNPDVFGRAVLAWDEYRDQRYQVAAGTFADDGWRFAGRVGAADERWLHVRTAVAGNGQAYLVWVALKPVVDKLGIIDHWPMAMVARLEDDRVRLIHDEQHPSDPRIVGDLRDGLLAGNIYKGYVGLRRNPALSVDRQGELWCVWESRGESEGSVVAGNLLGRRLTSADRWDTVRLLAGSGYGYAPAPYFDGPRLPVAHMVFDAQRRDVMRLDRADLQGAAAVTFDERRWDRWQVRPIRPEPASTQTAEIQGQTCRCYWADTHVHTVFSPDAEGELDELAHFARDQAGLQILTLIDNDYYPHKALTEPEWRIHQALAQHFSDEQDFLWIPGYEFTYHRGDLTPDFNHRCVLFPSGSGPLHRRIDPSTNSDAKMIPTLREAGAVVYPHHCTYELIDNDSERNVEVTSSWRVCIEETDFTLQQLRSGRKLGFIGSSDTHRAVPGLGGARTGVWATSLNREAVREAYEQRRLIATQGHNLWLQLRVAGLGPGGIGVVGADVPCRVEVRAPKPIDYVELVRDGQVVRRVLPHQTSLTLEHLDPDVEPGQHFYFLRVKLIGDPAFNRDGYQPATNNPQPFSQDSRFPHNLACARGPFAWTSPLWVTCEASQA